MDMSQEIPFSAEKFLSGFGKEAKLELAAWASSDQAHFDLLVDFVVNGERPARDRAAWVMREAAEQNPQLVVPHLHTLTALLNDESSAAVLRNILGLFQSLDLPETLWGEIADPCFRFLNNPQKPIAVRVFAMTVLYRIVTQIPELKTELQLVIEAHMPFASTGFQARGRKILAALRKLP